jgi:hypothetical protein
MMGEDTESSERNERNDSILSPYYLSAMAHYRFVTEWQFPYQLVPVWDLVYHMDQWPAWWKYVKRVEKIREGNPDEIGSVRKITWSTALPYSITFDSELTHLELHRRIEGKASGDLTGTGIWTFSSNNQGTLVRYEWSVMTTRKWMQLLDPLLRPIFAWNHDKVMAAGYEGIVQKMS